MNKPEKETLTIELKSDKNAWPLEDLYSTVAAMANTDGGVLYLGIEDNGDVTGLNPQHNNVVELKAKIQTHTVPSLKEREETMGKRFMRTVIQKEGRQ